jgi:hypothetical protein
MIEALIRTAIEKKRCLTGVYKDTVRRFAPHALGTTGDGTLAVFAFQYGGTSSTELPRSGQWRCFHLDGLSHLVDNDDRWRSRSNYSLSRQSCLARIDLAVPTAS